MKVRSRWFVLTGGLGGLVGFALLELLGITNTSGSLLLSAVYFAGFGVAVGAALGVTEGLVLRRSDRLVYGLVMGLVLGGLLGFLGGGLGQFLYNLVPTRYVGRSTSDIAVALDSSGSMKLLLWGGNDPWGARKRAAKALVDTVSATDRIAVIDFDDDGERRFPLTFMTSEAERSAAKRAVDTIDNAGGTNLSAGLDAALRELESARREDRRQFLIFLTDGHGTFQQESVAWARRLGVTIYTLGLGDEVDRPLLEDIAKNTGGRYFPVAKASALTALFENIFTQHIGMATKVESASERGELDSSPVLLWLMRVLAWGIMGLCLGLGQGIRENTREDLRACSLGGLLGGLVGGAVFNPVTNFVAVGGGVAGRALADLVVGACIGGSMRFLQQQLVEESTPGTTLLSVLPPKNGLRLDGTTPPVIPYANRAPLPVKPVRPPAAPPAAPPARAVTPEARTSSLEPKPPLTSPDAPDRDRVMARAYRSGHYSLREIAEHFGTTSAAVKRAVDQQRD